MMPMRMLLSSTWLQVLSLLTLWVAITASSLPRGNKFSTLCSPIRAKHLTREESVWIPRGGSSTKEESEEEDDDEKLKEDDNEDESETEEEKSDTDDDDNEDESASESESEDEEGKSEQDDIADDTADDESSPLSSVISSEPATVTIKTNLGNPLIDQSIDLLVSRTRNVESVKQTLSRQLPGRPPVSAITLMSGTRVLGDDVLIDELIDDEEEDEADDDDDEEEESSLLVLTLDMVPPVDPKFATSFDNLKDMTTSELLDAYAANAAAMYHNAQSLVSSEQSASDKAFGSLNIQLRHEAYRIRNQLTSSFPELALAKLKEESPPLQEMMALNNQQRRGQRYRSGRGGAKTTIKRMIQRNLNVNWPDTIRNFLLFIFFGLFGGRNTVSKNLLLLGAPLCFVLQARPVKILLKQIFYALHEPPSIFLSLLPAPQQAILSFQKSHARIALYGIDNDKMEPSDDNVSEEEEEDDEFEDDEFDYDSADESD